MSDGPIIGIDLGTTFSCVGVWDWNNRRVDIIPNENGSRTTPSVVCFTNDSILVGEAAKAKQTTHLDSTIFNAKRIIGRSFSQIRSEDLASWPFDIVPSSDGITPRFNVNKNGGCSKLISAEEVSAAVLAKLKALAEKHIGKPVKSAVVCVPAYFTEPQKQATKDAARLAGLDVIKLLTEPTAAALAYGLDKNAIEGEKKEKAEIDGLYILVFDLGGGTFDVSVLKLDSRGSFITKAVTGDFHLGGEDFDERILRAVMKKFADENSEITLSKKSIRKLRIECERVKRILSSTSEVVIDVDLQGVEFSFTLTKQLFEDLNADLFENVLAEVQSALSLAKIDREEVDDIVLVGGSTRIPHIQELLQQYFQGKTLWTSINPDEAVAYGAAIQAAALTKDKPSGVEDVEGIGKLTLTSVTPITLGIELSDGTMDVLIPRASKLPAWKSDFYTTAIDNQGSVIIKVYEGENKTARENSLLGQFSLMLDPAPAGAPKVEVRFEITTDGLFAVSARDLATNRQTVIHMEKPNLTELELTRILKETSQFEGGCSILSGSVKSLSVPISALDNNSAKILREFVTASLQRLSTSKCVSSSEIAAINLAADDCLHWLSSHPNATSQEVGLQRQLFELKWTPELSQMCG